MKINIFRFFKRKTIQDDFPVSSFQYFGNKNKGYPLFISLEGKGLLAYSSRFMVKNEDLPKVEVLIKEVFHKTCKQEKECFYDHGKTLCYYRFEELNHYIVDIITNDNHFIAQLNELKMEPPSPDRVFIHKDLGSYGSLQGDLAFWWDTYWEPFWDLLTEQERNEYVKVNNLSAGTVLFLMQHQHK